MQPLNPRDILLVHPLGYRPEAAAKDISRLANLMPPIGLLSLSAYLDGRGLRSGIVDCNAFPQAESRIRNYLTTNRPALIGFSCTTSSFLDAVRLARGAKQLLPGLLAVFGGPHVSALREAVLRDFPEVDFVVAGEGEESLAELMESAAAEPAKIPGLVYREPSGEVRFNGYREQGVELDRLPFPAYDRLEGYPAAYKLPIFNYPRAPNTTCVTSRGCPYACSYCDRSVFRRSFRYNSAEYIYEHLRLLRSRYGMRHVNFYDDQFTFQRARVEELARRLVDAKLGLTFNCAARAEHIDPELLRLMKAAGCWMISLGIETGDPDLLSQHRQNANLDLLAEKIRMIRRAGIRTKGLFMMGLPGETEESIRRTMEYAFSLPIDDLNVAKFTPFPGTPLYAHIREQGEFEEDWERMDCMHFQFVPRGMTRERLQELFQLFYKRHYTRFRVMMDCASMTWRSPDSMLRFVSNFGDFFRFARSNRRLGDAER